MGERDGAEAVGYLYKINVRQTISIYVIIRLYKGKINTGRYGMDKISGSMEVLSSLQITADTAGLDQAGKEIYKNKEVLAVILKGVVREFASYSYEEIMDFIEADSITGEEEVSSGRTNTKIQGDDKEFTALNEKVSLFDTKLRAVNPELSDEKIVVNLHIDIEPQKTYRPGYPIEKRGMYYLARELGAQLSSDGQYGLWQS